MGTIDSLHWLKKPLTDSDYKTNPFQSIWRQIEFWICCFQERHSTIVVESESLIEKGGVHIGKLK